MDKEVLQGLYFPLLIHYVNQNPAITSELLSFEVYHSLWWVYHWPPYVSILGSILWRWLSFNHIHHCTNLLIHSHHLSHCADMTKILLKRMQNPSHPPGRVAQSVGHLTRKSGVPGSIPGLATYFRFSFRFFKKGSCQLLAKVCAQSTG